MKRHCCHAAGFDLMPREYALAQQDRWLRMKYGAAYNGG
jgi:hypothetical protein